MGLVWHKAVWVAGLALVSVEAGALPFISLDPRANAMGGAGVAAGRSTNAAFINPALLLMQGQQDGAVVGAVRYLDPRNLQDEIEHYQDGNLETALETALAGFKEDPSTETPRRNLATSVQDLIAQMNRFSGRAIEQEESAGFAVNLPGKNLALLVGQQTIGGGRLVNVAADVATYTGVITALNEAKLVDDPAFNIIVSGPERNLQTKLVARGAVIREFGLVLARETQMGGQRVVAAVTPKYVDVTTFDHEQYVSDAVYKTDTGQRQYASFNVDLGLATEYGDGWRSGVAIKNLIPRDYQTVLDGDVRIWPQARAGVAYGSEWFAVALDLDLNEAKAVGFESDSQYLAMGGELSLSKSLRLRGGYRYNMSNTKTNAVTMGMGFGLFGAAADIAVSLNEDELGLSAQLGFRF